MECKQCYLLFSALVPFFPFPVVATSRTVRPPKRQALIFHPFGDAKISNSVFNMFDIIANLYIQLLAIAPQAKRPLSVQIGLFKECQMVVPGLRTVSRHYPNANTRSWASTVIPSTWNVTTRMVGSKSGALYLGFSPLQGLFSRSQN